MSNSDKKGRVLPIRAAFWIAILAFGGFQAWGARYRLSDGYCFEGPCEGESLEPIEIESGSEPGSPTVTIAVP